MRALLIVVLIARAAAAQALATDGDVDPSDWKSAPARLEWSTWVRAGWGVFASPATTAALGQTMPQATQATGWQAGAGAEASLRIGGVRLGPWTELRADGWFGGLEAVVPRAPRDLRMFWYDGEGAWILRAGASRGRATAALAWGYRVPWRLWGPYNRSTRYMIGARFVFDVTRSLRDPHDWSTTLGIEVEPVGALRYLLGITGWY